MIVKTESLDRIFEQNNHPPHYRYSGKCRECGTDVLVSITKTSGGYGLQGGVLLEANPHGQWTLCLDCYSAYDIQGQP